MKKYRILPVTAAVLLTLTAAIPALAAEEQSYINKEYETDDTLICIGSVSKMFVTTAVMQLSEQGKINIDAPVTEYLPDFYMADPRYKDITVRMLMDHTSGLMGTTQSDFMLFNDRDRTPYDILLSELKTQRLKADPGDFSAYCNDGFELLELITENVSGMSFTDYVEENICKPLDMQQTGTPWNAFRTEEMTDTFINGNIPIAQDYCMDIGSGGILSTAEELTRFGSAFFKGDTTLLSDNSKQEMSKTAVTDEYEGSYGLGWDFVSYEDYENAGVQVISKGGDIQNQHAMLLVAPDEEISVSVLSAGGSSSENQMLAMALMDIALAENGTVVEHSKPQDKETLDTVPDKYLDYADIYFYDRGVAVVSFPDKKYMQITDLSGDRPEIKQFLYTTEDSFVLMDGSVESGNAVQSKNHTTVYFKNRSGTDYICSDEYMEIGSNGMSFKSYNMQRSGKINVSDEAQAAWDARNGKKYYLYSGKYSNTLYSDMSCMKLKTYPEARGYVNGQVITDSDHAQSALSMPGGRDLQDIEMRRENGYEIMDITTAALEFISEDAIGILPDDITEIPLHTKKASWYSVGDSSDRTLTLEIPENASVYVYDAYDRMTYSSYMTEYGNDVPLPVNGKIVFLGEDGGIIKITQ